jgi:hypothetical protein
MLRLTKVEDSVPALFLGLVLDLVPVAMKP